MHRVVLLFCWRIDVGSPHWCLLAFGCGFIYMLRWRPLGGLSPINVFFVVLLFYGVRISLVVQIPGVQFAASGVQARPFTVASKFHHTA